ncbi:MAG TPA: type IV secretion system DNA-binding domain-containing protein [Gemmatimonadaceae bacterium]|nr:type IV secretion system DNA-binding domain-containing protein [Gemmatimonadaceae bacterium]
MNAEPLTFIGRTKWRDVDRPFGLRSADRHAHMYVIGKTGTGKSSLVEGMIRQDMLAGNGLALFDPHGDLAERLYAWVPESRKSDVIYLNVPDPTQPFGFNPLENVSPLRRSLAANSLVETLKKLFDEAWGVRLEYILRNALLLLLEQPEASLSDVFRLFHEKEFRIEAAERATNEHVRRFWLSEFEKYGRQRSEAVTPIENKLGSLLVDPFVSRILTIKKSTFNPREAIDSGKMLIVNLAKGKIGEAPAMLFGGLLVTMLGLAGLSRSDTPQEERRDFFIYLDEFQTFTTLALVNMFSELRKYRLAFVLANQFMDQTDAEIRSAILGNVGTLVVFRVGAVDAGRLVKELLPDLDPYELTLLPNRMFWIRPLVGGQSVEAFTGETITLSPRPEALPDGQRSQACHR